MKRFLLSLLSFFSLALISTVNAQCTISNVTITPTNVNSINCQVTFDLSYTADVNGGAKYAVVHLWNVADYPSPAYTSGQYPLATSLTGTMLGTLIIANPGDASPTLQISWPADMKKGTTPSSPILQGNFSFANNANGTRTYTFRDVTATVPNCANMVEVIGDVWATQNSQNASCLASRAIDVVVNDPVMRGLMTCSTPRSFSVSFKTLMAKNITFSAYKDANDNGVFDQADLAAGKLNLSGPGIATTATDVTVSNPANQFTSYGFYTFTPQPSGSQYSIFVVARAAGNLYDNVLLIENSCAALPVAFKSFTATKGNSSVALRWTTASESNSKGFYVQRFYNGQWENLMFVASKAEGGNSQSDLNYTFTDNSNLSGTIQYRILQLDMDNKTKFSEIRSISDAFQASRLLVYPNPSTNGIVSIVLNDANASYDIQVLDGSGRIVKLYNSVRNTLQISSLPKGQYLAKVINQQSGESKVEKFIILK